MAGMKTIIALAFLLATGVLLVILNWLPLLVALIYVLAPVPNAIFKRIARVDIWGDGAREGMETGYFITSIFTVSGLALPAVLAHSGQITPTAAVLSFSGGFLVYLTILGYSHFFVESHDPFRI
ncbi:vacuolar protein sorting 55 [Blyttiomyces helicus]|uniref:Vacuolar protein sorting 55 n=1 Tax=Blyttiomyces helicus TaxID=388810 RepID=A0A4P9WD71_9FUNG|nr:vacuolar protein sorting 55 [Blyttiomyces helicus]|eukprot:RKO88890.1 vacuolar protein sorting 55 [Blyttiomyces helicus]